MKKLFIIFIALAAALLPIAVVTALALFPNPATAPAPTKNSTDCKRLEKPFIDKGKVIGVTIPQCEGTTPGMGDVSVLPVPHNIPISNVNNSYFVRGPHVQDNDGLNATPTNATVPLLVGHRCSDGSFADVNATCPPSP